MVSQRYNHNTLSANKLDEIQEKSIKCLIMVFFNKLLHFYLHKNS
jgi:hypothetical protein